MHRSTHIFLSCLVVCLAFLDRGYAEKKQSIATAEFLSVLAKNVATVLSPTLVGELQDGRPNRTASNTSIAPSTSSTSTTAKTLETTTEPLKSSNLEADTVRSAQTQSEVRPGNQGFPFNFDDNYRYNFQGINSQGLQRPDFSTGPFGNPGYYNSELYRAYAGQNGPESGLRPVDSGLQRGEQVAGVSPVETAGNGQTGRALDSLDPNAQNLERFRNFDRFPFNNQYPGQGNFQNFPFQSQRQDGRFVQPLVDQYNPNIAANPNILGNANYQDSVGANYPRNSFQSFADPFQQRQQGFRSNSFDLLPSQRFQNAYDNYPRSLQRGPNFPGFYPGHFAPELRDSENFATPAPRIDVKKAEEASSSELSSKSQKLETGNKKNSTDSGVATENSDVLSVQGQIRFGRLLLPALEDYSDLRFQPDSFRQYLFTPNNDDNKNNNNNSNSKGNDI